MDNHNEFTERNNEDGIREPMFQIEVADGNQGRFFNVRPLGNARYELLNDDGSIGTIQLDEADHAHCESQGCEIDLPLLHSIRDQIRFHQQFKNGTLNTK